MMRMLLWLSFILCAALRPMSSGPVERTDTVPFPGWSTVIDESLVQPLPLTEREEEFLRDFPGRIGRFTDGRREMIVRWVRSETRKLHPASDCFRGAGYSIEPLPLRVDGDAQHWGCFKARREERTLKVCERIRDDRGKSFSDTSAWFWAAILGRTTGPWWAETVAEPS